MVAADDLIWPLFLVEGERAARRRALQPGVERLSVDDAVRAAVTAADAGIPALCFFPMTDPAVKDPRGLEATNPDNLVCRALRAIKAEVPHIGLMTDAALDLYTTHGHDGVMAGEEILNDAGRPRCACLSGSGLRRQTWPFQSWRGAATMRQ